MKPENVKKYLGTWVTINSHKFGKVKMILNACIIRKDHKGNYKYSAEVQDRYVYGTVYIVKLDEIMEGSE